MTRLLICMMLCLLLVAAAPAAIRQTPAAAGSSLPLEDMVKSIESQPNLANQSFYYDDGFRAIGSFSVHDHFAKRMCIGYLVSDGRKVAYRYIRAMPGLGSSNDAFETEFANIARVEFTFYEASKGVLDYYPERLSVKFFFKTPITGILANWNKKDIKFDIWDVRFGKKLMEFIRQADIPAVEKG